MFTGIIEATGIVRKIERESGNLVFTVDAAMANELKIDQSLAHDGVCLTVTGIDPIKSNYKVTAIQETISRTNLSAWKEGSIVNLERCLKLGDRLDGHWVQGHVDQTGICKEKKEENGSWLFQFEYDASKNNITVEKGSICVNGVSLTVVNSGMDHFSVAIIPYTFEHTNFKAIEKGSVVNLEFDILGKYISRIMEGRK
jgi:riboflavin synthase